MENSKNFDKHRFQPLDSILLIAKSLEEFFNIFQDFKDGSKDYPGVVVVKGISKEQAQQIARKVADKFFKSVVSSMDIITNVDPNSNSIRASNQIHPDHTDGAFDHAYVPLFALHFEKVDALGGGETTLKPTANILNSLSREHIETLINHPVVFAHKDENAVVNNTHPTYAIRERNGEYLLTYSWDTQVNMLASGRSSKKVKAQVWDAINHLHRVVDTCPQAVYPAQELDFIFVFNYKVLHGRRAILSSSPRIVNRWYFGVYEYYLGLDKVTA